MAVKIGVMSFAHMHAYAYTAAVCKLPEARLMGIADHDPGRGREMAEKFETRFIPSYQELLKEDIDAVIVTSENCMHKELTIMAAEAGKHVMCEKPISTNVEDAKAMIDACRKNNVQLMTAFPCRYSPAVIKAREAILAGRIGEVLSIKGTNHGKMPGGWFIDKAKSGGGAVIDHTVHVADLMRWILESEPSEVYAEISNAMFHDKYDDCGMLSITFENGVFSTLDTSWTRPKSFPTWGDVTMSILGTEGVIEVDLFAQSFSLYSDKDMAAMWPGWGDNTDYWLVKDFVSAVAEGRPVSITGEDGLAALAVALAAYKSSDAKAPVKV
ncbi:MAG: Gfo/Idh/MocA family oxidoreductase [Armatimonadota bacterium]|jgi:UDP-N-acetylglucosamine 3-dehydrogenase